MAISNSILFMSILLLQLTMVVTQITWEDCGSKTDEIKLLNLTVIPDPIIAPGSVSIQITIYANQNLTNPLKATLSLKKKTIFGNIHVPCMIINSCTFDDLCALCTECNCPIEAGNHTLNLPTTIPSNSWILSGIYQAQINIESYTKQKGCVQIYNILIKTQK